MTFFQHRSVRTKLSLVLITVMSLIITVGIVGLVQVHAVNSITKELREGWLPRLELLGALRRSLDEQWLLATRRLETTNFRSLADVAQRMAAALEHFQATGDDYRGRITSRSESTRFAAFLDAWQKHRQIQKLVIANLESGNVHGAASIFHGEFRIAFQTTTTKLDDLVAHVREESRISAAEAQNIYRQTMVLTSLMTLAGGICTIVALVWSRRAISTPILRAAEAMRQLNAGRLNLVLDEGQNRSDEIGILLKSVSAYRDSLVRGQRLAQQAGLQRERLHAAVAYMPIGLCMFDADQRLIVCNEKYREMFGLDPALAAPGMPLREIYEAVAADQADEEAGPMAIDELMSLAANKTSAQKLVELPDGRTINVIHQPMANGGWIATHEDVTERRRAEQEIEHLAHHDPLTQLPNRLLFKDEFISALKRAESGQTVALLCIDLDRFKNVNDTLGHPIGDALLIAVAGRLRRCLRNSDTVARLGGDEFAIIQVDVPQPSGSVALAERLIEMIGRPFDIEGHSIVIGASVGIALAPQDGINADQLLKNADLALYSSKMSTRGTFNFFSPDLDAQVQSRSATEHALRAAVSRNDFQICYEPLFRLQDMQIVGFEAHLRWREPDGAWSVPENFMPVAEEVGLAHAISAWALDRACMDAAAWPGQLKLAFNLSPVQLEMGDLVQSMTTTLQRSRLAVERLILEVSEAALLKKKESTPIQLRRLNELGVELTLDHFGIGYSSLSYLQRFPWARIKLDSSLVGSIAARKSSLAIIRAVRALGDSLGLEASAAGIETVVQLGCLREEGYGEGQGALLAPMIAAHEIESCLSHNRQELLLKLAPQAGVA